MGSEGADGGGWREMCCLGGRVGRLKIALLGSAGGGGMGNRKKGRNSTAPKWLE